MQNGFMLKLLSPKNLDSLIFVREEEILALAQNVKKWCALREVTNVSKLVSTFSMDIICRMTFGKKRLNAPCSFET
jgi:hypothetical protein